MDRWCGQGNGKRRFEDDDEKQAGMKIVVTWRKMVTAVENGFKYECEINTELKFISKRIFLNNYVHFEVKINLNWLLQPAIKCSV